MIHELKTSPKFFGEIVSGVKTFEVRKADRPFCVGDFLALNEYQDFANPDGGKYTGRCVLVRVIYILRDERFCKDGHVIMGFMPCAIAPQGEWDMIKKQVRIGIAVYSRGSDCPYSDPCLLHGKGLCQTPIYNGVSYAECFECHGREGKI